MMRIQLLATSALCGMVLAPGAAVAQDTAGDEDAQARARNGEIIVTARKREENLIDVPVAITAIGEEEIQAAGIEDLTDLSRQVPGFSFKQAFGRTGSGDGGGGAVRPSIRGMSNILGSPNAGFFVDGIFVSQNVSSYQLDNLERVEVIRGPQSALFGRQTFSGAINFVTRKPGNELHGAVNATVAQWNHQELSGYIQVPLINDRLALELNGRIYRFGGDYVNQDSGKRDINGQSSQNFGIKVRATPSDNFEMIVNAAVGHDRDRGYASFVVPSTALNCFLPKIIGTVFGIPRGATRSRGYFCGEVESPKTFAYNNAEVEALGYFPLERSYFRGDTTFEYTTDSDYIFTLVGAYNWQENQNGFDNTYLPSTNPSLTVQYLSNYDYSFEGRIQTPQSARIRALLGAYYYNADDDEGFSVQTAPTSTSFGRRSGFTSADGVRNMAAFGLLEFDVTGQLTVSAEARYAKDTIYGSREIAVLDGQGAPTDLRSVSYTKFLPRFTARYELASNWNLYGSVAKGNKPGGFNDLPVDAMPSNNVDFSARGLDVFDEESIWSYELGTKGRLGGFNFNLAGYYIDWSNQQLTQSQPYQRLNGTFFTTPFIVNAGKSRIKGFEAEFFGSVTDWLDIRLAYSYNDARFVDFYDENHEQLLDTDGQASFLDAALTQRNPADVDGPNGQVAGNRIPQTPAHQLAASTNIEFPISSSLGFFFRTDFSYDTKRFTQTHNLAHTGDSYNLNLRSGVEFGNLKLTAFVDNVTDDRTPVAITRLLDFNRPLLVPDPVRTFAGQPVAFSFYRQFIVAAPRRRQFGLSGSYRF